MMSGKCKKIWRRERNSHTLIKFKFLAEWKGEKKARLARSKYEKTWNVSRSSLKRLVNKALPVKSEREWNSGDIYSSKKRNTSDRWAQRWEANTLGHNAHWGEEGKGWGVCFQMLSPAWLWNPTLPCKARAFGHARDACAEPFGLTWYALR